jgi:transcriptional regulator with XRE-family HTH domain
MTVGCYNSGMPWDSDKPPRDPRVQRGMDLMGSALKRRRERLGMSQRELERRTGVDQSTISKFENGRRCGIRWSRFARIVAVLDGLDFGAPAVTARPAVKAPSLRTLRAEFRAQEEAALQASVEAERAAFEVDEEEGRGRSVVTRVARA